MWENIALQAKSLFPMLAKEMCANTVRGAVASLIPLCWGGLQGLPQRGGSVYNIRWESPQVALSKHKGAYIHALQD